MSNLTTAVARTAPIAIAPKPAPYRQDSICRSGTTTTTASDSSFRPAVIPCVECRRTRTQCIMSSGGGSGDEGDGDGCVPCQKSGAECSLVASPPPRKRKLNGEAAEDGQVKRSSPPGRSSSDNNHHSSTRRRRHQNSSLSSTAGSSSFLEAMANVGGPTLLKRTLGLQNDRYSQYIGPTTDFEPSLINLSSFDPQDESLLSRGALRKVSENDTFLMLPDSSTPGHEHQLQDADDIEKLVEPHGRQLIDLYFRVVHPAFPIIEKAVFLEKYARGHREFSPPLLAAIYILALNWWDHSEELAQKTKPNVRELERLMRVTLADAMYRPKLSTVQAGLLLSQRPEGDQWAPTAQLVAIAQELGLHLDCSGWKIPPWEKGLRKRLAWALYMQDKWGALVHGRPSHIFASNWAVQTLTPNDFEDDSGTTSGGLVLGGGTSTAAAGARADDDNDDSETDADAAAVALDEEDRLELERGRALFTQMVRLSGVLAEILDTFYTLEAMGNVAKAGAQGTHMVLALAKPIQLKLKEWYGGLPNMLRIDSSYASGPTVRLNSVGYLHLAYFATEITLHRRIIRSLSTTPSTGPNPAAASSSDSTNSANTNGNGINGTNTTGNPGSMANNGSAGTGAPAVAPSSSVDPYIQHICRSAAKARLISAMDFVNRLSPNHLRAFWYFASKTNFALIGTFGSLLWATSPAQEEAAWYQRRLGEYRWTLSVSSKPGEGKGLTEFAMTMLDISTGLLKQLPEKPSMSRSGSVADLASQQGFRTGSLSGVSLFGSLSRGSGASGSIDPLTALPSTEVSGGQSPGSGDSGGDSSDDDMYDNFAPTAGMASMAD